MAGYESTIFHTDLFRLVGLPDNKKEQEKMYKRAFLLFSMIELKEHSKRSIHASTLIKRVCKAILKVFLLTVPDRFLLWLYDGLCTKYPYDAAPYAGYLAGKYGSRNMFSRAIFDEYITVDYAGIAVRIVKEYDFYLKQLYGDYMELPSQEDQEKSMNKTYIVKGEKSGKRIHNRRI